MYNEIVKSLFLDNYNFNDILDYLDFKKYELLAIYEDILLNYCSKDDEFYESVKKEYLENIIFLNLQKEKVLIISDTHYGSEKSTLASFYQLRTFLQNEEISILFHGGDIGDGLMNPSSKYNSCDKQIDYICRIYPKFKNTTQYILGGNHDMEYKKRHRDILRILANKNKDIIPLGYSKSFFKIYNHVIAFQHMKIKSPDRFIHPEFSILGHSHRYRYKEKRIHIPPSCLENPGHYNPFIPGFLVMQALNEETLQFQMYAYSKDGPIMMEKEKVYMKKK